MDKRLIFTARRCVSLLLITSMFLQIDLPVASAAPQRCPACYGGQRLLGRGRWCRRAARCAPRCDPASIAFSTPQAAVAYWTGVLARQPANADAYQQRAEAWAELDENDKAVDDLGAAIRIQPNSAKFRAGRAELLFLDDNRRHEALADINRALEIEPANDEFRMFKVLILAAQKPPAEAVAEIDKIAQTEPNDAMLKTFRATLNLVAALNDPLGAGAVKAVDDFAAVENEAGENNSWMLILHAAALEKQGKDAEAIADYTRYLDQCPDKPETPTIYQVRASAYYRSGDYARALEDYSAAIRLAPDKFGGYAQKAWFLATCSDASVRDGKAAVELATRACELNNWRPWVQQVLAAAYAECGEFDRAIERQTKALAALDAPPEPKPAKSKTNKKVQTIVLWSSSTAPQEDKKAKRQEAVARLESYRQQKPVRE